KKASRTSPTDNVSDDLNRREAERAAGVVRDISSTTATPAPQAAVPRAAAAAAAVAAPDDAKKATGSEPPTVAAIPPRSPIVATSLTPNIGPPPGVQPPPAAIGAPQSQAPAPKVQETQARPPAPGPVQPPTPTPIQPPTAGSSPASPNITSAPSRPFAQSQL